MRLCLDQNKIRNPIYICIYTYIEIYVYVKIHCGRPSCGLGKEDLTGHNDVQTAFVKLNNANVHMLVSLVLNT